MGRRALGVCQRSVDRSFSSLQCCQRAWSEGKNSSGVLLKSSLLARVRFAIANAPRRVREEKRDRSNGRLRPDERSLSTYAGRAKTFDASPIPRHSLLRRSRDGVTLLLGLACVD